MQYKIPELVVEADDPFKNDRLNRKQSAEVLTDFVSSFNGDFVLCIDSGWGTGKTTFIRMWQKHLENHGFYCIYFNAWESDYSIDPLVPLIGEIQTDIISGLGNDKDQAKAAFRKAQKIGGVILRRALPAVIKIASQGVIDADEITDAVVGDALADFAKKEIEEYEEGKKSLKSFRDSLSKFALELNKETSKPLIFFIDELDRCRPTYAIELLERVKHLFNIPGIVFVLSLDKDQICHSIKSLYGQEMDVDGYLRRFIDLYYSLPDASEDKYFNYLFDQSGLSDYFRKRRNGQQEIESSLDTFSNLSHLFELSLRIQEKSFLQYCIVLRTIPENSMMMPAFIVLLITLREVNRSLYDAYVKGEAQFTSVIEYLSSRKIGEKFIKSGLGIWIEACVAVAPYVSDDREIPYAIYQEKSQKAIDAEETNRYQRVSSLIRSIGQRYDYNFLAFAVKHIELVERFSTG